MTEHVCSRKYLPSTKGTSYFGVVWNWNRWSVFEPSAIAVNIRKHVTTTRVDVPRKRPSSRLSLSSVRPPEISSLVSEFRELRELVDSRPVRDWLKKFEFPEGVELVVERKTI